MPKSLRILKRSTYQSISRTHQCFVGGSILVQYRPSDCPRIGLTVTRKFGPATQRNRFKRLAREAFRNLAPRFPPLEMIILPKKGCAAFSLDRISHDLKTLADTHAQSPATKGR